MILEGLMTTLNDDGSPHLAPMGPIVHDDFTRMTFRPFHTSTTGHNLLNRREGVFHLTDDALLLARAAVGEVLTFPETRKAKRVQGVVMTGCCAAYEVRITEIDVSNERYRLEAEVLQGHKLREFIGFNRARNAIVEAAIHATRFFLLDRALVEADYERFQTIVDKTGGAAEQEALSLLWAKYDSHYGVTRLTRTDG